MMSHRLKQKRRTDPGTFAQTTRVAVGGGRLVAIAVTPTTSSPRRRRRALPLLRHRALHTPQASTSIPSNVTDVIPNKNLVRE